jgi:hypothetical protein
MASSEGAAGRGLNNAGHRDPEGELVSRRELLAHMIGKYARAHFGR